MSKSVKTMFTGWTRAVLIIAVVVVAGVGLTHLTFAATGSLTFTPSSGSFNVGDTFNVTLVENSGSDPADTIDAFVTFPTSLLQFVGDTTVAPFSLNPSGTDTASGGTVQITRAQLGTTSTGQQTVSVLSFKVLAAGSATVGFNAGNSKIWANGSDVLTSSPSATFTLVAPATGGGTTGGGTTGGGSTSGGGSVVPSSGTTTTTTNNTSVNVGTKGTTGVKVPNGGSVAVSSDVTVQPTTQQTEGVTKVEYYLGDKLVATETKAPYAYNIQTSTLKNGKYDLKTKTYYDNGTTKESTQHVEITKAASKTKINPVGISLIAIAAIVGAFLILHRPRKFKPVAVNSDQASKIVTSANPPAAPQAPVAPLPPVAPHPVSNAPAPGTVIQVKDQNEQK